MCDTMYLEKLTDDFGIWQHAARDGILKKEGYALDDIARGMIVFILYQKWKQAQICLQFIERAFRNGTFVGVYDAKKMPVIYPCSLDALGLTYWALAYATNQKFQVERCQQIRKKIQYTSILQSQFIRPLAYMLFGEVLLREQEQARELVARLIKKFCLNYQWFEEHLTYANPVLPFSLLQYVSEFPHERNKTTLLRIIERSMQTIERYYYIGAIPSPPGNQFPQNVHKIRKEIYGQQPIDAGFMVLLYIAGFEVIKKNEWIVQASQWMDWFYGNNIWKQTLINSHYACADGLDEQGVSTHYGAESTIMYLWAKYICASSAARLHKAE
ncbi:MAG TPA: hypothetical protein VJB65_04630 [Patescibacteria group bacterium]|nr:hypothetical protein [Patescibacteria group bacterium]